MRTGEERIAQLHLRAEGLRRQREKRQLAVLGGVSSFLMALLVFAVVRAGGNLRGTEAGSLTASSMLEEGAGAYVLVAVAAFLLGVVITALIRWYRSRDGSRSRPEGEGPGDRTERPGTAPAALKTQVRENNGREGRKKGEEKNET